jgi:predicted nuclease with TOPRIM domain
MSDLALAELKQKNKALRKFLIEETQNNKSLQSEVDRLRIEYQEKNEIVETLQMTNQRLLKRIEGL